MITHITTKFPAPEEKQTRQQPQSPTVRTEIETLEMSNWPQKQAEILSAPGHMIMQ